MDIERLFIRWNTCNRVFWWNLSYCGSRVERRSAKWYDNDMVTNKSCMDSPKDTIERTK